MPEVLILGGTDITIAVAEAVLAADLHIAAIVYLAEQFEISYSDQSIRNARFAPIADWGEQHGIAVIPFAGYDDLAGRFGTRAIPVCLVAGWYHLVPRSIRELFGLGCLGFHASLLPQLRGGAPLNWAILAGLPETGVTLFELGDGVDDGPIYGQIRIPIGKRTTIGELVALSRSAAAELVRSYLSKLIQGQLRPQPQAGVPSYGLQRSPDDGRISWSCSAEQIERLVRAVGRPYPGAFTNLGSTRVTIWAARVVEKAPQIYGAPGQLLRLDGLREPCVVAGKGLLALEEAEDHTGASCIDLLLKSSQKRFY